MVLKEIMSTVLYMYNKQLYSRDSLAYTSPKPKPPQIPPIEYSTSLHLFPSLHGLAE